MRLLKTFHQLHLASDHENSPKTGYLNTKGVLHQKQVRSLLDAEVLIDLLFVGCPWAGGYASVKMKYILSMITINKNMKLSICEGLLSNLLQLLNTEHQSTALSETNTDNKSF